MAEPMQLKGIAGLREAIAQMTSVQQTLAAQQNAAEAAANAAAAAELAKLGALVEAAIIVAAADKVVTEAEVRALCEGMAHLSGPSADIGTLLTLTTEASSRVGAEGQASRVAAVASVLQDAELRRGALLIASGLAWLGGGVGEKEGLALQALARAFGIAINDLHKIMAEAHR